MVPKFSKNLPLNKYPNKHSGFSLLELIVAIAILSTVLTMLYNAFFQVADSTTKAVQTLEAGQEIRLLMKIVRDDLQAIQYLNHFTADNDAAQGVYRHSGVLSKRGRGPDEEQVNSIHFHAAVPLRFPSQPLEEGSDPELHEVSYFLDFDGTSDRWLFKRREDFYVDDDITSGGTSMVLSEFVTDFKLEFIESIVLGAGGVSRDSEPKKEWDSAEGKCDAAEGNTTPCLPLVIKLTMTLHREGENPVTETNEFNIPTAFH